MIRSRFTTRHVGLALAAAVMLLAAPLAGQMVDSIVPDDPSPVSTLETAGLTDALWSATVAVESGGDPCAYNTTSGATGIAQIRAICLADCNRIAQRQGLDVRFTPGDRWDPQESRRMWVLYLGYYGARYAAETGEPPTEEVYARIWKGGPTGWRKTSTAGYWERVRSMMEP
jgi:hypothetical protein